MLELLSITVDPAYARRLWAWPGNTVFVDLEITGKERRQAARDTVINQHAVEDALRLAALPGRGPLLVRVNAVAHGGAEEAAELVRGGVVRGSGMQGSGMQGSGMEGIPGGEAPMPPGTDRLMLPMFRTRAEVDAVVEAMREAAAEAAAAGPAPGGKAATAAVAAAVAAPGREAAPVPPRLTLLAETGAAVEGIEEILAGLPAWVDHVHLGLNDLSLERGTGFLFAPVATGEVAELARRVRGAGRRFGFGGVGMPESGGPVPAERILGEHVQVGSSCVILSRAFHAALDPERPDDPDDPRSLAGGLARVRAWEARWRGAPAADLDTNHQALAEAIERVLGRTS